LQGIIDPCEIQNEPARQPSQIVFTTKVHHASDTWTLASTVPLALRSAENSTGRKHRAAIIGHTGAGNYGHGLDLIFAGRSNLEVVAVSDADSDGRAKAAARTGAARQYADYHEMLAKEKPDLVSVAPRWTIEHHDMGLAALKAGAHIFLEKPVTRTLAEAMNCYLSQRMQG